MSSNARIKFWGVRGSVPSPLSGASVRDKLRYIYKAAIETEEADFEDLIAKLPLWKTSTYGGNTSCVEVVVGDERIVLDMGTGIRLLGDCLMPEMFSNNGLEVTFLMSHVHWDHIQGFPFFAPLYANKESGIRNKWYFYGGTNWQGSLEQCLSGQMDRPKFPVSWEEVRALTARMRTSVVHDRMSFSVGPKVKVYTRKLNHPQETYGWRIECNGQIIVYTTDNEPYDPLYPDQSLLDLTRDADVWITDCQYTRDQYNGKVGISRHGWGHSYPEAVGQTASLAGVQNVVLFHHDPSSTDEQIAKMEHEVAQICGIQTIAAYEGLEINL